MSDKIFNTLSIIFIIIFICIMVMLSIAIKNMIDDHNCWEDNYQEPQCQKYIRGGK